MRIRRLVTTAVVAGGLLTAGAGPAIASPSEAGTTSCTLTVSNFYYSIGMQTANAQLTGGCSGPIDMVMEQAASPAGPFWQVDTLYHLTRSSDGTRVIGYFTDPEQRGYCRAKATAGSLTGYSPSAVSC